MADEIKQKIVLEGEKEYSAALKEANRNLKTLKSALKAESAELGSNATAQQKNEVKARSLQKQIAEQEKVVTTLQNALKEAKEKYGDNADEVAKWEQKLNNARYTLANMNNDLQKSQDALADSKDSLKDSADAYGDAADAATDYANATDAAGQVADAVTFQSVMNAADNLKDRLVDAIGTIKELGKAAWDWMVDSGKWADELDTQSTKLGIDKETLQGWHYASRFIDTEVSSIETAYSKLTDRSKSVNDALAEIGIKADAGVDAGTVFWEVVDALHEMDDVARRNAAKNIFGKSYQDLMPLIEAGRDAWEGRIQQAKDTGKVLTDEQVENLTQFDDAREQLEASFESLQRQVAEKLAPAFKTVADALSDMVDKFIEWSQTEEGQTALNNLGTAIENIVTSLTGDIDFNKIVGDAQKAIEGFTGALDWISKNWETVKAGIVGIGAVIGGLTVASDVLSALQLIKGIKWSMLPKAPTAPTTPTAPVTAPAGGGKTTGGGILTSPWAKAFGGGVAFLTTLFENAVKPQGNADVYEDENGVVIRVDTGEALNQQVLNGEGAYTLSEADIAQRAAWQAEEKDAQEVSVTPEMRQAAEEYWDALRNWRNGEPGSEFAVEDAFDKLDAAFAGQEEELTDLNRLMEELQGEGDWVGVEDLPDWWFTGPEALTSSDIQGFRDLPGEMEKAVARGAANGVSGLTLTLDGYTVGRIVAPYVSEQLALDMQ